MAQKKKPAIFITAHKILSHPATAFVLFFILMFSMFSMVRMVDGDDFKFSIVHQKYSWFEYLKYCYQNRNGRFLIEGSLYYIDSLQFFWRWLCAISATTSALMIYKFITFGQQFTTKKLTTFAWLCCFSIGIITSDIISPSLFWVTGSYAYLMPFSIALVGFAPFLYTLRDKNYKPEKASFLYLIPSLLTMVGQEQVSLCFTALSVAILIYLLLVKRTVPKLLWVILICSLIVQIFALTAPGTSGRFNAEVSRWFPKFPNLDLPTRVTIGAYYLLNTIINQWYLLLIFLWITIAILLKKFNKYWYAKLVSLMMFTFALLMSLKFFKLPDPNITENLYYYIERVFTFHYLNPSVNQPVWYVIPYLFWTIAIITIPVSIYLAYKKTTQSFFYVLLFFAALASITVITFSPTLFVSGGRTSFVSNMLLIILILFLVSHADLHKTLAPIMIGFGAFGLLMLYWTWQSRGFDIFMGNLDVSEIPYIVRGIN